MIVYERIFRSPDDDDQNALLDLRIRSTLAQRLDPHLGSSVTAFERALAAAPALSIKPTVGKRASLAPRPFLSGSKMWLAGIGSMAAGVMLMLWLGGMNPVGHNGRPIQVATPGMAPDDKVQSAGMPLIPNAPTQPEHFQQQASSSTWEVTVDDGIVTALNGKAMRQFRHVWLERVVQVNSTTGQRQDGVRILKQEVIYVDLQPK